MIKHGYSIKIKTRNKGRTTVATLVDTKGRELMATIADAGPDFAIKGLLDYIKRRAVEGGG